MLRSACSFLCAAPGCRAARLGKPPDLRTSWRCVASASGIAAPVQRRAVLAATTSLCVALLAGRAARAASLHPLLRLGVVPTAYEESVRDVVSALTDTITFEASGASEREVRRRADPAKARIERFLRDWKGSPIVSSQPSYVALVDALRQLGAFYAARGSRAALTPDVREAVLAALRDADAALRQATL